MTAGIEFRNVTKRYGTDRAARPAVDAISFEVPRGTLTTLLGPSGCGKTTTLRMIAGLESPSSGQVFIEGQDVTLLGPTDRNVSMVFQSYALFPHLDVLGNVGYGLRMQGLPADTVRERALAMLETVGLTGFHARLPAELSGGQQQRVALARALVLQPAVLLFDEPLSNLDARLRREMREEIRALQLRLALTVAYVTHDQEEAMAVSDQIVVMDHGVIAQCGTPADLYERPANAFVAGFMGEASLFPVRVEDGAAWLGPLRLRGEASSARQVAVRPEAWRVVAAGEGLPARVARRAYLGAVWEYAFDTEPGRVIVTVPSGQAVMEIGQAVGLVLGEQGVALIAGPSN